MSRPLLVARKIPAGTLIADAIKIADGTWSQMKGLIGRKSLAAGEGLWFPGTNSIHMWFMSIAIDALFVGKPDADGLRTVKAVRSNMRPWRNIVWWVSGANGCLELEAGALDRAGVAVGDLISLT